MVSTFTPNKGLEQPANNDDVDTWDVPVNANMTDVDIALGGSTLLNATALAGNVALTLTQYRPFALLISGAPSAAVNYQVPAGVGGFWSVYNGTTGGKQISVGSAAGGSAINIPVNTSVLITCDGSASGMRVANTPVAVAGGSNTQVQYNSSGILAGTAGFTFDGTTLSVTGLNIFGNTYLGLNSGSIVTLAGTTVNAPNGLNINSGALYLTGSQLGVGTTSVGGNAITAAGVIQSLTGGFKFPDGTTQSTAAAPGTSPGGATGNVQFNNGGVFAGQSNFTFNTGTGILTVPALALTTPLAVAMGGTGTTTSTGTGAVVLGTGPTISNLTLTGTPTGPTATVGTTSTQLATCAFVAAAVQPAIALGRQVYGSAGTYTFTPTVTGLHKFTLVGPGGNGATGGGIGIGNGAGGGGGGTVITWASLTAGTPVTIVVGAHGAATTYAGASAGPGGDAASTTPGGGGTASGGDINTPGSQGGYPDPSGSQLYAGSGGGTAQAPGVPGSVGAAIGGVFPGGGGSGAAIPSGGGAGASGMALVEW